MCCGSRMCMMCMCLIAVVIAIGFLFGFGVFKDGFHKLKESIHASNNTYSSCSSRPCFGFHAPPPF